MRAGTNTLEHSVDLDDATLAQMARQGTIYVPTIDHNRYYADFRADYGYTDDQAPGFVADITAVDGDPAMDIKAAIYGVK